MVQTGLLNAILTGIVTGSVIALGAIGLSLVYSIAEVPNFAHGELLTIGAYMAFFVNRPDRVPVYELLAGPRTHTAASLAVLFVLVVVAILGVIYLVDGRDGLRGSWWPADPPAGLAIAVHVLAAAAVGGIVLFGAPSIWSGLLLSGVLLAAGAPLLERGVFGKFREKGVDLATMLIVALGVSFVLRFGTQALYSGQNRTFVVPNIATVLGVDIPLSAAQFFDFYVGGAGIVVRMINTKAVGAGERAAVATVAYPWPLVAVVLLGTVLAAAIAHRWRQGGGEIRAVKTVGPRLAAGLVGVPTFFVLALLVPGAGKVPADPAYATRISLSLMRGLTILIALGMMGGLHLLLRETKLGKAMRATSDNRDLAQVTGIDTGRVLTATWVIAGAYAAIGGVMLGVLFAQINPNLGFFLLLPMFAGVILGGVGSVYGAILGSYVVGLSMDLSIFAFGIAGPLRVAAAFAVLIVVLLVKPEGIVGGT